MATANLRISIEGGGISASGEVSATAVGHIGQEVPLVAAVAGTLTTRTDNDTGVVTLAEGHGITDADTINLKWDGGERHGMTVTGYDTTTVTIDLGAGDNLPDDESAVLIAPQITVNTDFDGDDLELAAIHASVPAIVTFHDSGDAVLYSVELTATKPIWYWALDLAANPLTGNAVDYIMLSGTTAVAGTAKILALYDSVA